MNGASRRLRGWAACWRLTARVAFCAALAFPASAARAVIGVGEAAPEFSRKTGSGEMVALDTATSAPFLLVFLKPDERYTSEALTALDHIFARHAELEKGLRRLAIVSRIRPEDDLGAFMARLGRHPAWPVVLDPDNKLYDAYRIVATPTVVLVGGDRKVAATHAGFDPGMQNDIRGALAAIQGVALPTAAAPPPPDMQMQTARRLLSLGLYDRALTYYEKAMIKGPLSPAQLLELAEIYIGLRQPDLALQTLGKIPAEAPESGRILALTEKAKKVQAALANGTLNPPRVQSSPQTSFTQNQRP